MCIEKRQMKQNGYALISVLSLLILISSIMSAYLVITNTELKTIKASRDSANGFNAAEAGLNLRAEEIRSIFLNYTTPTGVSPTSVADCDSGSLGNGDFKCKEHAFQNSHYATTFVKEDPSNPIQLTIPPGEAFTGLTAQEFRYTVTSVGRNSEDNNESILGLTFQSRKVPLFQFAIFFQDDLEIMSGFNSYINGPIHTNSDLYLAPQTCYGSSNLRLSGQVTVAGDFDSGLKYQKSCFSGIGAFFDHTGKVHLKDPIDYKEIAQCTDERKTVDDISDWNDNIITHMEAVSVPSPEEMAPFGDGQYWQKGDLRVVLKLHHETSGGHVKGAPVTSPNSPTGIYIMDSDNNILTGKTQLLNQCVGTVKTGNDTTLRAIGTQGKETGDSSLSGGMQFRQFREFLFGDNGNVINYSQRTLEVDMMALLNCIDTQGLLDSGKQLDDDTQGGLVFFFTIEGPLSDAAQNNYAIRIRNGAKLQSNNPAAKQVKGLTIISDQNVTVWGNYNYQQKIPAAIIADTISLLSNNWVDSYSKYDCSFRIVGSCADKSKFWMYRNAKDDLYVNAAILAGMTQTGGANGVAGQDKGHFNDGYTAIFRLNEDYRKKVNSGSAVPTYYYKGSIVSLGVPRHTLSPGPVSDDFNVWTASDPTFNMQFDTSFNDPDKLPPMTPSFIYLRQELFERDYEM